MKEVGCMVWMNQKDRHRSVSKGRKIQRSCVSTTTTTTTHSTVNICQCFISDYINNSDVKLEYFELPTLERKYY